VSTTLEGIVVANLSFRDDDFIGMLLQVRGRARTTDFLSLDSEQALELLQSYRSEHPELSLELSDGQLLPRARAATPDPSPEPVEAQPAQAYNESSLATEIQPEMHSDYLEEPAVVQPVPVDAESAYSPPSDYVVEPISDSRTDALADSDWPVPAEPVLMEIAPPETPLESHSAAAPQTMGDGVPDASALWDDEARYAEFSMPTDIGGAEPALPWLWWLAPILFTWLGGLVAWAVLRAERPRAAKKLLIVGLVATVVVPALVFALMFALGMGVLVMGSGLDVLPLHGIAA
jgi:hypothetical protein